MENAPWLVANWTSNFRRAVPFHAMTRERNANKSDTTLASDYFSFRRKMNSSCAGRKIVSSPGNNVPFFKEVEGNPALHAKRSPWLISSS